MANYEEALIQAYLMISKIYMRDEIRSYCLYFADVINIRPYV